MVSISDADHIKDWILRRRSRGECGLALVDCRIANPAGTLPAPFPQVGAKSVVPISRLAQTLWTLELGDCMATDGSDRLERMALEKWVGLE